MSGFPNSWGRKPQRLICAVVTNTAGATLSAKNAYAPGVTAFRRWSHHATTDMNERITTS